MNLRPSGYEPDELPGCSIPRQFVCPTALLLEDFVLSLNRCFFGSSSVRFFSVREFFVLVFTRFGGDLLSQGLSPSTIGATALNFRVRDGTGCFARAMTTKPSKYQKPSAFGIGGRQGICKANARCRTPVMSRGGFPKAEGQSTCCPSVCVCVFGFWLSFTGSDQANRAISTGQLNALLHLHLRPIDVVVFHGPQGYLVLRGASRLDAFSGYPVRS